MRHEYRRHVTAHQRTTLADFLLPAPGTQKPAQASGENFDVNFMSLERPQEPVVVDDVGFEDERTGLVSGSIFATSASLTAGRLKWPNALLKPTSPAHYSTESAAVRNIHPRHQMRQKE